MTPTTLAETILRDVRRYTIRPYVDDLPCLLETDVLAALTAAMDHAIAERAGEIVPKLQRRKRGGGFKHTVENGVNVLEHQPAPDPLTTEAADLITVILAQNAALRAERDELSSKLEVERALTDAMHRLAKDAEAQIAALTARVEGLTGALETDADLLFDAYKGLLVLRKMLDVAGLKAGVEAADSLIERMETTHPEMPGRSALRAALTTEARHDG